MKFMVASRLLPQRQTLALFRRQSPVPSTGGSGGNLEVPHDKVADDWEACCDHHRFVPGAFVWGRGVLALRTEGRRPAAYSRKTVAA
jgi:hypothetical protein